MRAVEPETLLDFDRRLRAVAEFAKLPEAAALAAANKRIGNILRQAGASAGGQVDAALLDTGAEAELYGQIEAATTAIDPLLKQNRYVDMLRALATLRAPVDRYFDEVMVMVDDAAKRQNRLLLLGGLRRMFVLPIFPVAERLMSMSVERQWLRAQQYIATNQISAAKITLESRRCDPSRADARMLLCDCHRQRRQRARSGGAGRRGSADPDRQPRRRKHHRALSAGSGRSRRSARSPAAFRYQQRRDGRQLTGLAQTWQALGGHVEALTLMDRAQANGYDNRDFRYYRSLQLMFNGRTADAERELEACLRQGPTFGRASVTLARLRKQTQDANHVSYIRQQLGVVQPGSEDHAAFEFALFEELEDLGRYDEAFAALQRGNDIMYALLKHDRAQRRMFEALQAATPAQFVAQPGARPADPRQYSLLAWLVAAPLCSTESSTTIRWWSPPASARIFRASCAGWPIAMATT